MADDGSSTTPISANNTNLLKRSMDQMDCPEDQPPVKTIEVDPNGDLVLRVVPEDTDKASNPRDIKVSRHMMSLGSPVFATMLSSEFVEGGAQLITVVEDNFSAFVEYCRILHHQTKDLSQLNPQEVWDLARVADMRQSHNALRPWIFERAQKAYRHIEHNGREICRFQSGCVTHDLVDSRQSSFKLQALAEIAAMFDRADLFWDASSLLLFNVKTGRDGPTGLEESSCLPAMRGANGEHVYDTIIDNARTRTQDFLRDAFKWARKGLCNQHRMSDQARICQMRRHGMLQMLLAEEFWKPEEVGDFKSSFHTAYTKLDKVHRILKGQHQHVLKLLDMDCQQAPAQCDYCKRDLAKELGEILMRTEWECPGVCLRCFRAGKADVFVHRGHVFFCK